MSCIVCRLNRDAARPYVRCPGVVACPRLKASARNVAGAVALILSSLTFGLGMLSYDWWLLTVPLLLIGGACYKKKAASSRRPRRP
ncbi:hypothetical protein ACWCYL_42685 [Streptomyces sp. 900105755]